MNNNDIFLNFWTNFKWPEPEILYFRLYHDEHGKPICYSRHARPEKFIDLTPEQFAIGDINVDVVNGVLIHRAPPPPPKLKPSTHGVECYTTDVSIVATGWPNAKKWNLE